MRVSPDRPRTLKAAIATACGVALLLAPQAQATAIEAEAVLPPGQSGYVSIPGIATGTGSPHLTDQTQLFIDFELRPFGFDQPAEETFSPKPGVTIERDNFGIPTITGDSDANAWFGAGYAVAEDRLFELELFKRSGSGRLAEILGPSYLDDDLISRRDYYTDAELDAMIAAIPEGLQARLVAYRDGINAYIDHLRTSPLETPGEFVALGVPLSAWTLRDSARIGILLARTVPSGDGNELANAQALDAIGPKAFDFIHPVRSPGRIPTVKPQEGKFEAQPGRSRQDERVGFRRSQKFLDGIDLEAEGPGTISASGSGEGSEIPALAAAAPEPSLDVVPKLPGSGGSFMWAIRDEERKQAYLFNGPQLGFAIPELFVEFELHSPVQDIRGVTAPGVPLIGIGHNDKVAWGFTSGLSDEDDLFAEDLSGDRASGAESSGGESYQFRGEQRQMDCRDEVFEFNTPATDLPSDGPPSGTVVERICRTVHGPVQFRGDDVAFARKYAIWGRELETIVGLTQLNDARNLGDVDKAMNNVTWNENVMAVDSQARIGYWHPGLHPLKPLRWDERLPFPGDGRAEWRGKMALTKTPRVVNPERNWLANWNNPPSIGWTNGDGVARERLSGPFHRVRLIADLAKKVSRKPSYAKSRAIELTSGAVAQQFRYLDRELVRKARRRSDGPAKATLTELMRWDGNYVTEDANGTVAPGVSIWEEFKSQLEAGLLGRFEPEAEVLAGGTGSSHEYDISNGESLALQTLGARAYAAAAAETAKALSEEFGTAEPSAWRAPRLLYEVTAQGAGTAPELPFFDRGTWSQSLAMGR